MHKKDMSNNAQHVYFLQKKKAEILARKEREKLKEAPKPTVKVEPPPQLQFANDGSFLELFKLMQKQKEGAASASAMKSTLKDSNDTEKQAWRVPSSKLQTELKAPASIFSKQEDEVDAKYLPSDYDLAKELAQQVASEGVEVEAETRMKYQGNLRYRFLFDPSSPVAQYYQSQLKQCKQNTKSKKRRWDEKDSDASSSTTSVPQHASNSSGAKDQPTSASLSSSSTSSSAPIDPIAEFEKAKALIQAKAAALTSGAIPVAREPTEEEKKRQRAIDEQRMMNELYRKVIEQQALFAQAAAKQKDDSKPKYEYDSDEDTAGGTWEHKKRKKEMQKTEDWAVDLTEKGRGKHHLADFLPPEELEKFMENVKAVQEGREADISDYAKFKIQADNVGFQLLQKAGWEEGTGLGKKGDGIVKPVNKGKTSFDQLGLGADKPLEVKKDDDNFELYRKRMMLAYKFRPNPLNNPRRPYY